LLVGLALASPFDMDDYDETVELDDLDSSFTSETDRMHELFDVVESGLSPDSEGRALIITVTKTKYESTTVSETVTNTDPVKCYTTLSPIEDCASTTTTTTTTTTEATTAETTTEAETEAPTTVRRRKHSGAKKHNKHNKHSKHHKNGHKSNSKKHNKNHARTQAYNPFPYASVVRSDGVPATFVDLMPTPVIDEYQQRIDEDAFDGMIDESSPLSSGNLNWREVFVDGVSSCGRSNKRPRFLNVEKTTQTNTITMTSTVIAPTKTLTFTLDNISCTTSGFDFGVDEC